MGRLTAKWYRLVVLCATLELLACTSGRLQNDPAQPIVGVWKTQDATSPRIIEIRKDGSFAERGETYRMEGRWHIEGHELIFRMTDHDGAFDEGRMNFSITGDQLIFMRGESEQSFDREH